MNFSLTEEQKMIQEMCRRFAENEVKPVAARLDETGVSSIKALADSDAVALATSLGISAETAASWIAQATDYAG